MAGLTGIYNKLLARFGEQFWWPVTTGNSTLEIIIGAVLTQNTAWSNVEKAIGNLSREKMISIERMRSIGEKKLASMIKPSGYYNQKARKLKNVVEYLENNPLRQLAKMDVKQLRKSLLGVNGIGPETADSIILYALEKPSFVVDMYTKRIFFRIGLIDKNQGYEEVKQFFESGLPKDVNVYKEYHALIVELAKNFCKKKPLCESCPLEKNCEKRM